MGALQYIRNLFFSEHVEEVRDDIALLKEALRPAVEGLDVTGQITGLRFDEREANTAVFEVTVFTRNGVAYTTTEVEFDVPVEGLAADAAEIIDFLDSFGIDSAEALDQVLGEEVEVTRIDGNWEVQW